MIIRTIFLGISIFAFVNAANAADIKSTPVVKDMQNQGARFSESFYVDNNLEGVIADIGGSTYPIYKFKNSDYLFYGDILTPEGKNLTEDQIKIYPVETGDNTLLQELRGTSVVKTNGNSGTVIYSFIDINCPVCKAQWVQIQPYIKQGLNIHYILVAYIKEDSEKKAVQILSAPDPYTELAAIENSKTSNHAQKYQPQKEAISTIRKNNNLMEELGIRGAPTSFYEAPDGKVYRVDGPLSPALIERLLKAKKQ